MNIVTRAATDLATDAKDLARWLPWPGPDALMPY